MIHPEELAAMRERCEAATADHTCTETPYDCLRCQAEVHSFDDECLRLLAEVERLRKIEEAAMAWRDARIAWRVSTDEKRRASHLEALRSEMAIEAALDAAEGGE